MNYTRAYSYVSASPSITIVSNNALARRALGNIDAGRGRHRTRQNGPQGQLTIPSGYVVWNNSDGFGSGQVQYQGVNADYADGAITHVSTLCIDVWLDLGGPPYYLAKGIAPNGQTVDASFAIPPYLNGTYTLYVNETQEAQDPTLPLLTIQTDNPAVEITMAEPWLQAFALNASVGATGMPPGSTANGLCSSCGWPVPALAIIAVLGVATAILLIWVLYLLIRRVSTALHARAYNQARVSDLSEGDLPTMFDGLNLIATPFMTSSPPAVSGPPADNSPPPLYTDKSSRSNLSTYSPSNFRSLGSSSRTPSHN